MSESKTSKPKGASKGLTEGAVVSGVPATAEAECLSVKSTTGKRFCRSGREFAPDVATLLTPRELAAMGEARVKAILDEPNLSAAYVRAEVPADQVK